MLLRKAVRLIEKCKDEATALDKSEAEGGERGGKRERERDTDGEREGERMYISASLTLSLLVLFQSGKLCSV